MGKKSLKVVPVPAKGSSASSPSMDPLFKGPPPNMRTCPPHARAIIQQRLDAVKDSQKQLRDTVAAVGAGLGIDFEKENWTYNADTGVFVRNAGS
jgi:hypothetical protein